MVEKISRSSLPKNDYLAILLESLPKLRNSFAHPRGQSILFPHEVIFSLRFEAEFVNQLFSMPVAGSERTESML